MSVSPNTQNIAVFNNTEFFYTVALINGITKKSFSVGSSSIKSLVIEDDMFHPFHKGFIVFKNDFDVLERGIKINPDETIDPAYTFGGLCRDYLKVTITPKLVSNSTEKDLPQDVWTLDFLFVVYDFEDIQGDSPEQKYKKLHFHDFRYQILQEKNIQWSTSDVVFEELDKSGDKTKNIRHLSNNDRSIETGKSLKYLLNTALGGSETFDEERWNNGASKVFYTSPNHSTAWDDVLFLCKNHVSRDDTNNDQCFLRFERYTNKWTLESLSEIVSKAVDPSNSDIAGEYQLEKFIINEMGEADINNKKSSLSPTKTKNLYKYNINLSEYSAIESFSMVEMSGVDNQNCIVSKYVHNYDIENKQFNVDIEKNYVKNISNNYNDFYVQQFKAVKHKPKSLFDFDILREQNQNIDHVFSVYTDEKTRLNYGRNIVLKNCVFLNLAISFSSLGLTCRRSGRFLSINKVSDYVDSDYEFKLQGQWLAVKVTHTFSDDTYKNDIFAIKMYKSEKVS